MEENKLRKIVTWLGLHPVNTRTHRNETVIQRNDPCYCGNQIETKERPMHDGKPVKGVTWYESTKLWVRPVKFKDCCYSKHAVLKSGSMTPEMANFVKKQDTYFKKQEKKHG